MLIFARSFNEDGSERIDLVGEPDAEIRISREVLEDGQGRISRNGNVFTLLPDNGSWTYKITGYDADREIYTAELIQGTRHYKMPTAFEI